MKEAKEMKRARPNGAHLDTAPDLVGFPEFLPMVVVPCFGQCAQVAHAFGRPELPRALETALTLSASRLDAA